jgi:hypothetical protein
VDTHHAQIEAVANPTGGLTVTLHLAQRRGSAEPA